MPKTPSALLTPLLLSICVTLVCCSPTFAQDELARVASWKLPTADQIQREVTSWLDEIEASKEVRNQIFASLGAQLKDSGVDRLNVILDAIQILRPELVSIRKSLQESGHEIKIPDLETILEDPRESNFVRDHLRLLFCTSLVHNQLYDEAVVELEKLSPKRVLAPDTLLFFQASAYHQLMQKEKCLTTVNRLLENVDEIPRRFANVGRLIAADMAPLESDSLDEVSRIMNDIRRRQSLYRSGKKVRDQERLVMNKLDKLIEELEAQQKKMMQSSGGNSNPSSPMQDSQKAAGIGTGDITNKQTGDGGDWGNLPPAERAAALAEMAKDLPPHYRSVIEEYFRKLAGDDN